MDIFTKTKHGVTRWKIVGSDDEVQQQVNLLFETYPYDEYQTYVFHDEMIDNTRVVEIECNQFRCK